MSTVNLNFWRNIAVVKMKKICQQTNLVEVVGKCVKSQKKFF